MASTQTQSLMQREIRELSREVARLRAIVDWEKALENVPEDPEPLRPEVARRLTRQINRIHTGKEPVYYFESASFQERVTKAKTRGKNKRA